MLGWAAVAAQASSGSHWHPPHYRVVELGSVVWGKSMDADLAKLLRKHGFQIPIQYKNRDGVSVALPDEGEFHPCIMIRGHKVDLPKNGHMAGQPIGLNDRGDVVGELHDDDQSYYPTLWHGGRSYSLTDYCPKSYEDLFARAIAINNHGDVVVCDHPDGVGGRLQVHCWALIPR